MHARRYFVKALEANDARAAVPIAAFKTLYDVEADVKHGIVLRDVPNMAPAAWKLGRESAGLPIA